MGGGGGMVHSVCVCVLIWGGGAWCTLCVCVLIWGGGHGALCVCADAKGGGGGHGALAWCTGCVLTPKGIGVRQCQCMSSLPELLSATTHLRLAARRCLLYYMCSE